MPKLFNDEAPLPASEFDPPAKELNAMPIEPKIIENDVALEDWCSAKSRVLGRRIEALGAYHKLKQRQGVGRGTPDWFEADFQTFLKTPV